MAFRWTNCLLATLNIIILALSVLSLLVGIWISQHGASACDRSLETLTIVTGPLLIIISLAGIIGGCCRVTWLLWVYLLFMLIFILLNIISIIIYSVATSKGGGRELPGKGYKEYRLGDYTKLLRNQVTDDKTWSEIKMCLADEKVCPKYHDKYRDYTADRFYKADLSAVQSGCCKPSNDCQFEYNGPTNWTKGDGGYSNSDCKTWSNDMNTLCFNCDACKAGITDIMKNSWKKSTVSNIVFLVLLIATYAIGCCALRKNKKEEEEEEGKVI